MTKIYQEPVFQVVRQEEGNAKFFAASSPAPFTGAASMTVVQTNEWF